MPAQSFAPPLAGIVSDREGHPQRIFGVAGNLIPEAASTDDRAISLAFSGNAGIVKTASALILIDSTGRATNRFDAPPGDAQFGFDASGRPALVWFHKTRQLFALSAAGLNPLPEPPGEIAALATDTAGTVQIGTQSPALFVPGGMLTASGPVLTFRGSDGTEETVTLPGTVTRFNRMGDGWAAILIAGKQYGLRLSSPLQLFLIPEPAR